MKENNMGTNEKTVLSTDKFIVTVEIRYNDQYSHERTMIAICDTMEEAIIAGNKALDILKTNGFDIPRNNRFGNPNCVGKPNDLVLGVIPKDNSYHYEKIQFYAKIERFEFNDLTELINKIKKFEDERQQSGTE